MPVFVPDRKRTLRGERRVASLLDAAGHVFGELGYHAANTNAIAAEAKVSPATLYQFFPNKEAIADALVNRGRDRVSSEASCICHSARRGSSFEGHRRPKAPPLSNLHRPSLRGVDCEKFQTR